MAVSALKAERRFNMSQLVNRTFPMGHEIKERLHWKQADIQAEENHPEGIWSGQLHKRLMKSGIRSLMRTDGQELSVRHLW